MEFKKRRIIDMVNSLTSEKTINFIYELLKRLIYDAKKGA